MPINIFNKTQTISSTGTLAAGTLGNVKSSTDFVDITPDTSPDTLVDGLILPMVDEATRNSHILGTSTAMTLVDTHSRGTHHVEHTFSATSHGLSRGDKIALLTGSPNTFLVFTNVTSVIDNDTFTVRERGEDIDFSVADAFYTGTFRHAGRVKLGSAGLNFGTVEAVTGELVRVALVLTDDPSSGATFAVREAAKEIMWSRVYPVGTQIAVDWGGFALSAGYNSIETPIEDEKRAMLVTYSEAGTPVSFTYNYEITLQTETTVER